MGCVKMQGRKKGWDGLTFHSQVRDFSFDYVELLRSAGINPDTNMCPIVLLLCPSLIMLLLSLQPFTLLYLRNMK